MPRPDEDRSDVGGAAQFNNIGPVPLSALNIGPVPAFNIGPVPLSALHQYRTRPAFRAGHIANNGPVPLSPITDPVSRFLPLPVPLSAFRFAKNGEQPRPLRLQRLVPLTMLESTPRPAHAAPFATPTAVPFATPTAGVPAAPSGIPTAAPRAMHTPRLGQHLIVKHVSVKLFQTSGRLPALGNLRRDGQELWSYTTLLASEHSER